MYLLTKPVSVWGRPSSVQLGTVQGVRRHTGERDAIDIGVIGEKKTKARKLFARGVARAQWAKDKTKLSRRVAATKQRDARIPRAGAAAAAAAAAAVAGAASQGPVPGIVSEQEWAREQRV